MAKQCEHIKANGQQCRGAAIWGSEPPRCTNHRLDGGPRASHFEAGNQFGQLTLKHGYYSRASAGNLAPQQKVARCLLTQERLAAMLKSTDSQWQLLHLFRLFGRNLNRLFGLLAEYERATGRHPDTLLAEAAGEPLAALLAELRAVRDSHKNGQEATGRRAPRYWRLHQAIVDHIREQRASPSWRQLKNACGISSNNVLAYWLARLEEDGLIIRRPGRNGIGLPAERKNTREAL